MYTSTRDNYIFYRESEDFEFTAVFATAAVCMQVYICGMLNLFATIEILVKMKTHAGALKRITSENELKTTEKSVKIFIKPISGEANLNQWNNKAITTVVKRRVIYRAHRSDMYIYPYVHKFNIFPI